MTDQQTSRTNITEALRRLTDAIAEYCNDPWHHWPEYQEARAALAAVESSPEREGGE